MWEPFSERRSLSPTSTWEPFSERRSPGAGFSLIEIVLALLVFGVGILAILALFPAGVKLSNDSYMQTRMAAFAETTLNSVAADLDRNPDWTWAERKLRHEIALSGPQFDVWQNEDRMTILANATNLPGGVATNAYRLKTDLAPGVEDFVFRYKLDVFRPNKEAVELYDARNRLFCWPQTFRLDTKDIDDPTLRPTNTYYAVMESPVCEWVSAGDHLIKATLEIWPGRYGGQSRFFYRYYFKFHQ